MPNDNVIEFRGARGGPRTERGKRRSSMNSTRHGLYASRHLLRTEDRDEFEAFGRGIIADLGAVGPLEVELAEHIVAALWRLRRFRHYEATRQNAAIDTTEPVRHVLSNLRDEFDGVAALLGSVERILHGGRVRRGDLVRACLALRDRFQRQDAENKDDMTPTRQEVVAAVKPILDRVRGALSQERALHLWSEIVAGALMRGGPMHADEPYDWLFELQQEVQLCLTDLQKRLFNSERKYALALATTLIPVAEDKERIYGVGGDEVVEKRLTSALDRAINRFHANRAALAGIPVAPSRRARQPNASEAMRKLGAG